MANKDFDLSCLQLQHPFRFLAVGASFAGKTKLFDYILKNQETTIGNLKGSGKIDRLILCFAVDDPIYSEWYSLAPVCIYHKGLPKASDLENGTLIQKDQNNIIVLEDLDDRESECETIHRLFTVYSHHFSCSVLYSQHNLFMKNKRSVLINRNCNYLALLKNIRDKSAVRILAGQTHPGQSKFLVDAFKQATEKLPDDVGGNDEGTLKNVNFLLCDFSATCPEKYRYRETIGWPKDRIVFYEAKNENGEKSTGKR